jgi:membrane-associated protease RseP (regulator of RpoE activity)
MVNFIVYDLAFFALFTLGIVLFLYAKRDRVKRQGIIYLYQTKIGIKFIDRFARRFDKILKPMRYVVIISGYTLMALVMWILVEQTYLYLKLFDVVSQTVSGPPVFLLLPYAPKIFGYGDVLPPLYFTYFLIVFVVAVVPHEFAHGIFARLQKFKIHSTGLAFLGPILGAFVEPDEKQMEKAKKFPQMSVLAAGTFANVLVGIGFVIVFILFFGSMFQPAGIRFNTYAVSQIDLGGAIFGDEIIINDGDFVEISYAGRDYIASAVSLERARNEGISRIVVYDDSPAFRQGLEGAITEFDGRKITSYDDLVNAIESKKPGDRVVIKTAIQKGIRDTNPEVGEYDITLDNRGEKAFLGIGFRPLDAGLKGPLTSKIVKVISVVKDPFIYYESSIGEFGWFIYYLLWWLIFVNLAVALFNMLPLGILDGGRFFYLTVLGLTGSKVFAQRAFRFMTWLILGSIALIMVRWVIGFL